MWWGYVRNVLGLIVPGALFLVTHHQAFFAAYAAPSLPLTHYTWAQAHTSPNQGFCVPWSLTLNRLPQLNATDRQASGHQVLQPKLYIASQQGNAANYFHLFGFSSALFEKINTCLSEFLPFKICYQRTFYDYKKKRKTFVAETALLVRFMKFLWLKISVFNLHQHFNLV